MRISGDRTDIGYKAYDAAPYGTEFNVFIDGRDVSVHTITADDDLGFVLKEVDGVDGDPVVVEGYILTEYVTGKVVITRKLHEDTRSKIFKGLCLVMDFFNKKVTA